MNRMPRPLSRAEIDNAARRGLREGEQVKSAESYRAQGLGQSVVQVVVGTPTDSRSFVVDEDGLIETTKDFWRREREARRIRFGSLSPNLFERQGPMALVDQLSVKITIAADLPEPERPFDGTDTYVPIEVFEDWARSNTNAQVGRIAQAKQRVLQVLTDNGAVVSQNPRGLPTLDVILTVELLRSNSLNARDVLSIEENTPADAPLLGGYAGTASMNALPSAGGLDGGLCGGGQCDGGGIDIGYWESDGLVPFSGVARNSWRLAGGNVTGFLHCPETCITDSECCTSAGECVTHGVSRFCRAEVVGGPKTCVSDHLTWVVANTGMVGQYSYNTQIPGVDPVVNATGTFGASLGNGVWAADKRFGNDSTLPGLDFLVAPPPADPNEPCQISNAPPAVYVNRSQGGIGNESNFPGRAFGTFVVVAAGNTDPGIVTCARLKNGVCVGAYSYLTFGDQSTHRRWTTSLGKGSSHLNDVGFDAALERPHLLGPGTHNPIDSGIHMPAIDYAPSSTTCQTQAQCASGYTCVLDGFGSGGCRVSAMRHADYNIQQIFGTSFAAPAVLGIAVQAHQFEGWFSNLVFPMVNKAVLMAATRDANADGPIGKATTWSANAQSGVDGEDGGGQINIAALKGILTNNSYFFSNLADGNFSSCGAGCRRKVVATFNVTANTKVRAALAWQSCMLQEIDVPVLNNDLDLAIACTGTACPGTLISNTATSELEMVERQRCVGAPKGASATCSLEIRIKNGESLEPCGSTTTERVGVAWRFE